MPLFNIFIRLKISSSHRKKEKCSSIVIHNLNLGKANLLSRINIPYTSLLELYKMELSVQFIWNASLLRSKIFGVEEEITKKKFFRFYNRKTRPCPFVHQILTSYVPLAIISMLKKKSDNVEVNILENLIRMYESEKPQPLQPRSGRIIPDCKDIS